MGARRPCDLVMEAILTATFTWSFPQFCTKPLMGDLADVVCEVHWRLRADDGVHRAEVYGSVALPEPDPETFTDFDALDPATVTAWVSNLLDVAGLEARLADMLAEQAEPTLVSRLAPWD
jgi:predicted nucleotidyltransferase